MANSLTRPDLNICIQAWMHAEMAVMRLRISLSLSLSPPRSSVDKGGIVVYVPVLIVILVFVVLIAATIAGIALFKYESRR